MGPLQGPVLIKKHFTIVNNCVLQLATVFLTVGHFYPSPIFAGKAGVRNELRPLKCSVLISGSCSKKLYSRNYCSIAISYSVCLCQSLPPQCKNCGCVVSFTELLSNGRLPSKYQTRMEVVDTANNDRAIITAVKCFIRQDQELKTRPRFCSFS